MKSALCLIVLLVTGLGIVSAQGIHSCGSSDAIEVTIFRADNMGYSAKAGEGYETKFDCIIAVHSPNFKEQRFQTTQLAINAWYAVSNQETGMNVQPLSNPTS